MKKKLFIPVAVLALLGGVTLISATAFVQANSEGSYPPIIQKLVERFGLNEEEVKAVFDEVREEHRAEMQSRFGERFNEAVESGDLTEEQKQLILAKHEELRAEREANRESFQNMTWEERREVMEAQRAELESWAEENGVDPKYLFGGLGKRGGCLRGMKGGFGFSQ
jgi:hypothetical protein